MQGIFKWLTAVFAVMLASSIVSIMAAFVGSEGADFQDLLKLQVLLVPLAVAVVTWCFGRLVRQHGYRNGLRTFWNALPGWLLFLVLAANSLVLIAELSFVLIQHHTGNLRPWQEHVPAAAAFCSSLAAASCFVSFQLADGGEAAPSGSD